MTSLALPANASTNTAHIRLLRPRECATALGVSLTTLWRWTKAADFPVAFRLGANSIGFSEAEITDWLDKRRVTAQGNRSKSNNYAISIESGAHERAL